MKRDGNTISIELDAMTARLLVRLDIDDLICQPYYIVKEGCFKITVSLSRASYHNIAMVSLVPTLFSKLQSA